MKTITCARCLKQLPDTEGVHTCTPTDAWRKLENERDQYLNALDDLKMHGTPVVEDWVSVPVCEWEQVFKRIGLSA